MDRLDTKGQMIDQIDLRAVAHSGFDRSNHNYLSGKLGAIVPTRLDEVYPGDRLKGSPTTVANFEPLVYPPMASMVMKQECFFVPIIEVWKHGYKFYTGKNGFNEEMPSISPLDIYEVYSRAFMYDVVGCIGDFTHIRGFNSLVYALTLYWDGINSDTSTTFNSLFSGVSFQGVVIATMTGIKNTLFNVYEDRKMVDLILPICKHLEKFAKSKYVEELSVSWSQDVSASGRRDKVHKEIVDFISNFGAIVQDFFLFFFGPSSLFDYLGWPIILPKNLIIKTTLADSSVHERSFFEYYISKTVFDDFDDGTEMYIKDLFSQVPLVFLPFKANYLIWYWNYRDQLLEQGILDPEEDEFLGSEITDNVVLYTTLMRQRCWFKDAFTTALTNTGDGNLFVPTDNALGAVSYTYYDSSDSLINTSDAQEAFAAGATYFKVKTGDYEYKVPMNYLQGALSRQAGGESTDVDYSDSNHFLSLDLFDRIKRLRSVVQKRLILGYEVDDVIWSSFMVRISNARQRIPELLGRGRDAVEFNTVVNNTSTDQMIAGDKSAVAWSKGSISDCDYFAEEWGFYLQYMTIMPIQTYAGGMQRLYIKRDQLDWMWPEYATLGMDAVYNFELGAFGTHLSDENGLKVFGYQGRYYDLKFRQDEEHGRLRTDLNYLTFSREFDNDNLPLLNYMFVHCWPRLDMFVLESEIEDVFRADVYTAHGWERRLPVPSEIIR